MTAAWPSQPPTREMYSGRPYKRQVRSGMENGTIQSRAGDTRSRMKFTVGWKRLTETDLDGLFEHFATYSGNSFTFTTPGGDSYTVIYSGDELPEPKQIDRKSVV